MDGHMHDLGLRKLKIRYASLFNLPDGSEVLVLIKNDKPECASDELLQEASCSSIFLGFSDFICTNMRG